MDAADNNFIFVLKKKHTSLLIIYTVFISVTKAYTSFFQLPPHPLR
jgi:hypothetical protein